MCSRPVSCRHDAARPVGAQMRRAGYCGACGCRHLGRTRHQGCSLLACPTRTYSMPCSTGSVTSPVHRQLWARQHLDLLATSSEATSMDPLAPVLIPQHCRHGRATDRLRDGRYQKKRFCRHWLRRVQVRHAVAFSDVLL